MASLLDTIFASSPDDPKYASNMALFTRMMEGAPAQGFRESAQIMAGAKDQALKRSLLEAQIEETKAQADARKLAAEQARRKQDLIASVFGNGTPSQPAMPGQLGSGSFGAVSAPAGQPAIPPAQPGYRLASMNPDQIAMLKLNEMDILEPWKIAKQGFEQKPGMYRIDPNTGKMSYIMDPRDGRTVDASGRIGLAPGATEATLESGFASEFPKTVANALGTVNLRKGDAGMGQDPNKEYPVTSITENPTLQGVVDRYFPGLRQNVGAPTAAPATTAPVVPAAPARPAARPAPVSAQPGVTGSFDITDPSLLAGINDIKDPQERANALAALKQQQAAINAANGTPNPSQGYGKTTAQETADAAAKAAAIARAETGVKGTHGQQAVDAAFGKDYADFVAAGGFSDVNKQLEQLRVASSALKKGSGLTGPVVGMIPDSIRAMTNPEAVNAKELTMESVQRNLRVVLGAQFTQQEGQQLMARAFNPRLPPEENQRRVNRLITQIQTAAAKKEDAAKYFEEHGTLSGWQGKLPTFSDFNPEGRDVGGKIQQGGGKTVTRTGTLNGKKVIQYSDGTTSYAD